MRKTMVIVMLGFSTVALLGLCVAQRQQIRRLSAARAAPVPAAERETQVKIKPPATVMEQALKPPAAAARPQAAAPGPALAEAQAEPAPAPAPAGESPMEGIAKMMKNPGMKEMIRAQQKGQMDMTYGALFKCLQLTDAELESFKGLLLDRQMALVDSSMDLMSGAATPEEKKAAAERMKETTAAYDAQLKALLGDEDYAVYQSFEETQAERMQVTLFKGSLSAGDQMSEDQEDQLIRAMHDARSGFKSSVPDFGSQQGPDPSQFTPERIAKLLEENARLQEQYVAKAAAILTPAQLEQFTANQKQQQAMQEMGMNMAAKMFGQPAKEKAPANP